MEHNDILSFGMNEIDVSATTANRYGITHMIVTVSPI